MSGLLHIGSCHSVFVVLLVDEDVFLVRVDVALFGLGNAVAQGDGVGNECQGADDGHHRRVAGHSLHGSAHSGSLTAGSGVDLRDSVDTVGILYGKHSPFEGLEAVFEGLLEEREHLCKHTPDSQRVGTVHNPAAAVPADGCDRRGKQQGDTAEPAVRGQAVVGVGEVPDVIDHDEDPGHIGPDHIFLVFGREDIPPSGHTEDVEQTGDAVHHVVPAAIKPHAFRGEPPLVPAHKGGLEVGGHGDEDVDGHDDEGERFEPVFGADAPFVLDHHKADAAGERGVELGVVEPAVHIDVRLVGECPLGSGAGSDGDGHEIDRQDDRDDEKGDDAAGFGATGKLVEQDETHEDDEQHPPLGQGISPINLEKHNTL